MLRARLRPGDVRIGTVSAGNKFHTHVIRGPRQCTRQIAPGTVYVSPLRPAPAGAGLAVPADDQVGDAGVPGEAVNADPRSHVGWEGLWKAAHGEEGLGRQKAVP